MCNYGASMYSLSGTSVNSVDLAIVVIFKVAVVEVIARAILEYGRVHGLPGGIAGAAYR